MCIYEETEDPDIFYDIGETMSLLISPLIAVIVCILCSVSD